jgi:hypothetical protein
LKLLDPISGWERSRVRRNPPGDAPRFLEKGPLREKRGPSPKSEVHFFVPFAALLEDTSASLDASLDLLPVVVEVSIPKGSQRL